MSKQLLISFCDADNVTDYFRLKRYKAHFTYRK